MTVGLLVMDEAGGANGNPPEATHGGLGQLERCTPYDLDAALMALDEAVDGRCVSAWVLARPHWTL